MGELLQDLVTAQANLRPDSPAIVWAEEIRTYEDVERRSNQVARALRTLGCERGDRVCLLSSKTAAAVIAAVGVYKADAVYVALDPLSPIARVAKVVRACEPRCVLLDPALASLLDCLLRDGVTGARPAVISLGDGVHAESFRTACDLGDVYMLPDRPVPYRNQPASPAHIFFTPGSSGTPKGVVTTHKNVRHFVQWANQQFQVRQGDRHSAHASLASDLSIYDIFGTLASGACLFPVPTELNVVPGLLAGFLRRYRLTQWVSASSVLTFMAQGDAFATSGAVALARVIWRDGVLPANVLQYWRRVAPQARFTSLYGPTETTIASTFYTIPERPWEVPDPMPIGVARPGEQVYLLDEDFAPVRPGDIGEICIRGVGLSPGYWRDPEGTRSAFPPNPYNADRFERLYRTGDFGRLGSDGLVYLVGRRDGRVRCRGYPVELGEIETALQALPSLSASAVVVVPADGFEEAVICCAYVAVPGAQVTASGLRKQLTKLLPIYMLPSRWKACDRLPLAPNGKPDRIRVRRIFEEQPAVAH